MNRKLRDKNFISLFILILITLKVFSANQQNHEIFLLEEGDSLVPNGCSEMRCPSPEQCVTRKFWCKSQPCPEISYCAKSRKESLKGPSSCSSVRCNKGYVCLVKVHHCTWEENCRQRIARCITEREYYEGPASCADFQCPEGHKCILRESLCARPPCKVLKSCARNADAENWFKKCNRIGCASKYECFLRRPTEKCDKQPCKHTPDCMLPPENDFNENCRGWVCPTKHECSARILGPCKQDICKVSRSCKALVDSSNNSNILRSKPELKTLTDLEKDWFYQEEEKRRLQAISTTVVAPIINKESALQGSGYDRARQLFFKPGEPPTSVHGHNFEFLNNAWSVPNLPSVPIYKYPTYVASTVEPKPIFSPEKSTVKVITTTSSSPSWLESLKSRTGIDVINFWVKKAEENQNDMQFQQWLKSVMETLDPEMYRLWLEEVRSMTSYNKKFQDWLPLPLPVSSQNSNQNSNRHFSDFITKISDMEGEVLTSFPGSKFDETYEIPEYNEGRDVLTTTMRTIKTSLNDETAVQAIAKSSTFNNSANNSELAKSPVIPTFIIIQTSSRMFDPNVPNFDPNSQQIIQQVLVSDPRFIARLIPYQQFQQFQVPRLLIHNFMTPLSIYPYFPQNNFLHRRSAVPFSHWFNLLNSFPREYPVMPQINQNSIPLNYLHQYLHSLQGHKSFYHCNHPAFGYPNFLPRYNFNLNDRLMGVYDQKEDYFEIPESNFNSRRETNWKNFLSKREGNDFYGQENDEDRRSKVDRSGYQSFKRKQNSKLDKKPEFVDDKERQEQELQFVQKILQGILDYDFGGKNEKVEKKIEIDQNDILMKSLIHMLHEQLDDSQENASNPKLETLLDEIEKGSEKETKLLEEELHKFHENFGSPLLRRRKGDENFQSSTISQDSKTFPKNKTLVDKNLNSFVDKNSDVFNQKEFDKSIENLSKFFNQKEQNSDLNIMPQESTKMKKNSPEIILPKASFYDFVKNSDSVRNQTSDKNSTSTEVKQTRKSEREESI